MILACPHSSPVPEVIEVQVNLFKVMPLRLNIAYIFIKLTQVVEQCLTTCNVQLLMCLDYWLIKPSSQSQSFRDWEAILSCHEMKFLVTKGKYISCHASLSGGVIAS